MDMELEGLDEILASRRSHSVLVNERIGRLKKLGESVRQSFHTAVTVPDVNTHPDSGPAIQSSKTQSANLLKAIDKEIAHLSAMSARFSRNTVVLGAVGRSGMGKSEFLKTLTGLSDTEIPTGSESFLTGTTTVINHGEPAVARVHFISTEKFLSIVRKYFENLSLGTPPSSLDSFWSERGLPPLPRGANTRDANVYEHLKVKWESRETVRELVGKPPREIRLEEIPNYVVQPSDSDGRPPLFVAVEKVELTVPYPNGHPLISVIDLPGLGDTNLTDVERFLGAIRDDVDALVMVRRGDDLRDAWGDTDIDLYTQAQEAVPEVAMSDRAFLLLNSVALRAGSRPACERLKASAESRAIDVASISIVDVKDQTDVNQFFAELVEKLPGALSRADEAMLAERTAALRDLVRDSESYLGSISSLVASASPITEMEKARMVRSARRQLARGLSEYLNELADQRGVPIPRLQNSFQEAISRAKELVGQTSEDEFRARVSEEGNYPNAYNDLLQEMRARLGANFSELDPALRIELDEVKRGLGQVIAEAGRLGSVTDADADVFLQEFTKTLRDARLDLPAESVVTDAFDTLIEAEMTYRGMLQHRVRQCFRQLDPDSPRFRSGDFGEDASQVPPTVYLRAIDATVLECLFGEGGVKMLLTADMALEPSWAIFALIEEFVERALHSEGAEIEWEAIYRRFQEQIWPEEFAKAAEQSEDLSRVMQSADEVRHAIEELQPEATSATAKEGV